MEVSFANDLWSCFLLLVAISVACIDRLATCCVRGRSGSRTTSNPPNDRAGRKAPQRV